MTTSYKTSWRPDPAEAEQTNLGRLMATRQSDFDALHSWAFDQPEAYWTHVLGELQIRFAVPPDQILERPNRWLPGAELNIAQSCFRCAGDDIALVRGLADGTLEHWTRQQLKARTLRVAASLKANGIGPGDAVAIAMPMTAESVVIYLAIVWVGAAVVSIADSFSAEEIRTRLQISQTRLVFTQDHIVRGEKMIPLYARLVEAGSASVVVLPAAQQLTLALRPEDESYGEFLDRTGESVVEPSMGPVDRVSNILFSSGTTGTPKAIPWTQLTPIKAAADAWAHHDIQVGDVVVWPTNLGWMMGPWLIYASLLNGASIGVFEGSPLGADFARFVERARVSMLGVVPSLVKAWRQNDALVGCSWLAVRRYSSTGEASNPDDMAWLMAQAGGAPVLEYCGGTEIGGGYLSGSMVQEQRAGQFSTPVFGCRMYLLDDEGQPASAGEVALVSPQFGASQRLLNGDHDLVYFDGMPPGPSGERLRRHGDYMEHLESGFYRAHGRVDDTMNLGGIKVSSAEIERVVNRLDGVVESAAIAVTPQGGGPSQLVVIVVAHGAASDSLHSTIVSAVRSQLNPLFKVTRTVIRDALPRTASNKVMRRVLRAELET